MNQTRREHLLSVLGLALLPVLPPLPAPVRSETRVVSAVPVGSLWLDAAGRTWVCVEASTDRPPLWRHIDPEDLPCPTPPAVMP